MDLGIPVISQMGSKKNMTKASARKQFLAKCGYVVAV
jgi:hypothetical protein